jgi:hypothetical protein
MKKLLLNISLGLGIIANSLAQSSITNVTFPAVMTPGSEATIELDYVLDPGDAEEGWFRVVFGEGDASSQNYACWGPAACDAVPSAQGVNSWGQIGAALVPSATSQHATLTFTVPNGISTTTSALANGNVARMTVWLMAGANTTDENILRTWHTVTVNEAQFSGQINSFTFPASVEIGSTFDVNLNYTHNFTEAKIAKVFMLKSVIATGEILWSQGTFGYAEKSLDAATDAASTVSFTLPAKNDASTNTIPTSGLEAGQQWVILTQFLDVNKSNPVTVTAPSTPLNLVDKLMLDVSGSKDAFLGSSVNVSFEYQLAKASVLEISVVKFADAFTPATPEVIATNVVYSSALPASATTTNTMSDVYNLVVKNDIMPSASLTNGETYKLVVKVLEGNAETNTYVTQFNFPINILALTDGLVSSIEKASFAAYPNPISSNELTFSQELTNVSVIDATGNVVATANNTSSINIATLNAGIYMVKADQGTVKVVVE